MRLAAEAPVLAPTVCMQQQGQWCGGKEAPVPHTNNLPARGRLPTGSSNLNRFLPAPAISTGMELIAQLGETSHGHLVLVSKEPREVLSLLKELGELPTEGRIVGAHQHDVQGRA